MPLQWPYKRNKLANSSDGESELEFLYADDDYEPPPVGLSESRAAEIREALNDIDGHHEFATAQQTAPARKAETGTSYTAKGVDAKNQIQAPQLDQEDGSAQPVRIIELVPELVSAYTRTVTYTRMMTDAGVSVSMRAIKTPVLGASFYVDPYSADPQDILTSQFIEANLEQGMNQPLLTSLEDVLKMFEDGYSLLEKVHENREWTAPGTGKNAKIYTMLKKLAVRPVSTIGTINYDDNGGPQSFVQQAIRADKSTEEVTLDISKCCVFSFSRNGGDLTGRSLLRTAYQHWYYKQHLYKIDAISKERHGIGVPRGKLLPGYNPKDKQILRQMLRNLRTNEESFIIQTPNVEIDFVELKSQLINVMDSAEHHNMMLMLNIMAAFLSLGTHGSGGSRAVGGTQSDIFMKSLKYIASYICEVINMFVIPELVVWNFPTKNFPQLKVRNIGETRDLQMLGSALSNLIAQNGITMDLPTEQWIREVFEMPDKQPDADQYGPPTREQIRIQEQSANGTGTNGSGANDAVQQAVETAVGQQGKTTQKGTAKLDGGGNSGKPPNAPE